MRAQAAFDRRLAILIAGLASSFYALFNPGYLQSPDAVMMFQVTSSLVEQGRVDVAPIPHTEEFGGKWHPSPSGQRLFYSWFGIAPSVAAAPFYAIGKALAPLARETEHDLFANHFRSRFERIWYSNFDGDWTRQFAALVVQWMNAIVTGVTLALLYLIARRLGISQRAGLLLVLCGGLASPMWTYARTFFSEPLAALSLVSGYYLLTFLTADTAKPRVAFAAGSFFGIGALTRVPHIVLGAVALVFFASAARSRSTRTDATAFVGGFGLCLALLGAYNWIRFGDFLDTGRLADDASLRAFSLQAFRGLLLSPGRGILCYFPLAFASVWALARIRAAQPRLVLFVAASATSLLVIYSCWPEWHGGWCLGPRFLEPLVPFLILPLGFVIDDGQLPRSTRLAVGFLALLSFYAALTTVRVESADFHVWVFDTFARGEAGFREAGFNNYYDLFLWAPGYTPLVRSWQFPVESMSFVFTAAKSPGLVLGCYLLSVLGLVLFGWRLIADLRPHGPQVH